MAELLPSMRPGRPASVPLGSHVPGVRDASPPSRSQQSALYVGYDDDKEEEQQEQKPAAGIDIAPPPRSDLVVAASSRTALAAAPAARKPAGRMSD